MRHVMFTRHHYFEQKLRASLRPDVNLQNRMKNMYGDVSKAESIILKNSAALYENFLVVAEKHKLSADNVEYIILASRIKDLQDSKNIMSMDYCHYRFSQMLSCSTSKPKFSIDKWIMFDTIFLTICQHLGWDFSTSNL